MAPRRGSLPPADFLDDLAEFARIFPAWMDGVYPRSWRVYQVGIRQIERVLAREKLTAYESSAMAASESKDAEQWIDDTSVTARWR